MKRIGENRKGKESRPMKKKRKKALPFRFRLTGIDIKNRN